MVSLPSLETCKRHIVSIVLVLVWSLLAAFEVALPFIIFTDKTQNEEIANGGDSRMIYLYMCPVFIIPALGILSIIVSLFSNIAGIVLHLLTGLLNIGNMAYFILFFQNRQGIDKTKQLYQLVVPPLAMGLVAIMSLVLCIDQCRHAYYNSKKRQEDRDTHYTALEGGRINDDSDTDSD
jgi:hypothetical protein